MTRLSEVPGRKLFCRSVAIRYLLSYISYQSIYSSFSKILLSRKHENMQIKETYVCIIYDCDFILIKSWAI